MTEILRTWESEEIKVEIFSDLGPTHGGSHLRVPYKFYDNGTLIFDTEICVPRGTLYSTDDNTICAVLDFASLRDGDTDDEYFQWYNEQQIDWRDNRAEEVQLLAIELQEEIDRQEEVRAEKFRQSMLADKEAMRND